MDSEIVSIPPPELRSEIFTTRLYPDESGRCAISLVSTSTKAIHTPILTELSGPVEGVKFVIIQDPAQVLKYGWYELGTYRLPLSTSGNQWVCDYLLDNMFTACATTATEVLHLIWNPGQTSSVTLEYTGYWFPPLHRPVDRGLVTYHRNNHDRNCIFGSADPLAMYYEVNGDFRIVMNDKEKEWIRSYFQIMGDEASDEHGGETQECAVET